MKEYEIIKESVITDDIYEGEKLISKGVKKDKFNVYYYLGGEFECKEFHSTDGVNGEVRKGYTLKTK